MKKMLLMGARKVGKTSMLSVIFAKFPAAETQNIGYTVKREEHEYNLMGTLKFKLEDCPGQDDFIQGYFKSSVQNMVKDVQVLIYVFDINDNEEDFNKNLQDWNLILENIEKYNQSAMVFILLHKIDLVPEKLLEKVIEEKSKRVRNALTVKKLRIK